MPRPNINDYAIPFGRYISQVPEDDLEQAIKNQSLIFPGFLHSISEEKSLYAYAEGKWSIREVLQHLIDAERIFNYRSLCIARKETVSLPGFDEKYLCCKFKWECKKMAKPC